MAVAFFDVDETVIETKSMFSFLEHLLSKISFEGGASYSSVMTSIYTKVAAGASRNDVNAFYYSLFSGCKQTVVRHHAKEFFTVQPVRFRPQVVNRIQKHKESGDQVVFVSGAMRDIIYPIAEYLGVNQYLCSEPEVKLGMYTGQLLHQAIGTGKAKLVRQYCSDLDIDPGSCSAYGDDLSDQHMLDCVGHAVAVYPHHDLRALALKRKWEIIDEYSLK